MVMTRPLAPEGLSAPDDVRTAVMSSKRQRVLDQSVNVDPSWWMRKIKDAGLPGGPLMATPSGKRDDRATVSRTQVFDVARRMHDSDYSDASVLALLWHALAWGSGVKYRQNDRRISAMRSDGAIDLLRQAAKHAATDPRTAYSLLIRRGGGRIRWLGPSFFTKFLYFAGCGQSQHPCLILDANVARALHDFGWASLHPGWANWYTDTYVSYCKLLQRWAGELPQRKSGPVAADEIEYILFAGSKAEESKE